MFAPARLGQAGRGPNVPVPAPPETGLGLAGVHSEKEDQDLFSRSETWMGPAPSPGFEKWKGREDETLGMSQYVQELVSWANEGSVEFGREIAQAARWPCQIDWGTLTRSQQVREVRLFSLLKAAFANHGNILCSLKASLRDLML